MTDVARLLIPCLLIAALGASPLAAGRAAHPPAGDPDALAEYRANKDPLEPTNRFLYRVNGALDDAVLRPAARGYRYVLLGGVRRSIGNALANLSSPVAFANDVLQEHPRWAAETVTRFAVNVAVGLGGLFDPASELGLPPHCGANFGTTLALWGVGDGPFLFLPMLGPSSIRDAMGMAGNAVLDPFVWASFGGAIALEVSRTGVGAVDTRERFLEPVEQLKRDSLNPYDTFHSAYRQAGAAEIEGARHDGRPLPPLRRLVP